jgi:hypothetical protein
MWCIPPGVVDCEFVAATEEVLEVYQWPCDPRRPVVCLDEASRQLVGEIRSPVSPAPGGGRTASTSAAGRPTCSWRSSR